MKTLVIISTGRCGTKRISEILSKSLEGRNIIVSHQTGISRLANVLGNLMYYLGGSEVLKGLLFKKQLGRKNEDRIMTDPLMSMCISEKQVQDENTYLLHVHRPCDSFATSMFSLTRKRPFSFIAHNFIPFWQPALWPLENMLNHSVKKKYERICREKKDYFERQYGTSPNYRKAEMSEVFSDDFLKNLVVEIFDIEIDVSTSDLKQKSNQST